MFAIALRQAIKTAHNKYKYFRNTIPVDHDGMRVIVNVVQEMQEPRVAFSRKPQLQWSLWHSSL